jgi:Ca-activated chloride channel homolog
MKQMITIGLLGMFGCAGAQSAADPNLIQMSGAISNTHVAAEKPGEIEARIRVAVSTIERTERPSVNLVLAIDTSGSMEGAAIEHARTAALTLLAKLSNEDRIAIVTFDSETKVLVSSTKLDQGSRTKVEARIREMKASGTTDLAGGLRAALTEALQSARPKIANRIVLLSDGIPNDQTDFIGLADNAKQNGVTITALGLGLEYDETLLGTIASRSGGKFHFIEDSALVAKVFEDEVLELERVVARNAMLVLKPGPGVTIGGVPGIPTSVGSNREIYATLGDLSESDRRELFFPIAVQGRRDGANVELFDAVLSYDDSASAKHVEKRLFLSARATTDAALLEKGEDREVKLAFAKATIAASTVEAIGLARNGRLEDAGRVLERAEAQATKQASALAAEELLEEVKSMSSVRQALPTYVAPVKDRALDQVNVRKAHDRAMSSIQRGDYGSAPVTW